MRSNHRNLCKMIGMGCIITLTTDFGQEDGYAGVMKGVILSIAPATTLIDLTHNIAPQDVFGAALMLERSYRYFPNGTIHLVVVDPGVGTKRRMLAGRIGEHFFVGPDNGFISLILQKLKDEDQEFYSLEEKKYWLPFVSNVFHGRDIFAPVAAYLSLGVPLEAFGKKIFDPTLIKIPAPQVCDFGWKGEVIHIDHFGNLATNIRQEHLAGLGSVRFVIGGREINSFVRAYGEGQPGELVALIDSAGCLSFGVVNGNAQAELRTHLGDSVEVYLLQDD